MPVGLPDVLRAAHDVFINLTEERIMRIETLAQAVHRGQDAIPALIEIAQISHKIAGVAGTLEAARVLRGEEPLHWLNRW